MSSELALAVNTHPPDSAVGALVILLLRSTTKGRINVGRQCITKTIETLKAHVMSLPVRDLRNLAKELNSLHSKCKELTQNSHGREWPWAHVKSATKFRQEAEKMMDITLWICQQVATETLSNTRGRYRDELLEEMAAMILNTPPHTTPGQVNHEESVSPSDSRSICTHVYDDQTALAGSITEGPLLDIISIFASTPTPLEDKLSRLVAILRDATQLREILHLRGPKAQSLLNLIQKLLDPPLESDVRWVLVDVLIKLARQSGLYPECLVRTDIHKIGEDAVAGGQFGDVWKGLMEGREVAVKVLRIYGDSNLEKLLKAFSCEAVIWQQLSHPNILPFCGIYHLNNERTRVCLASPWMSNGDVRRFLTQFPEADRVNLVLDIARGLEYLHNMKPCIVHGDLKSANVLITSEHRACLADFGLAAVRDSHGPKFSSMSSGKSGGSLRWMAPELLDFSLNDGRSQGRTCPATDVYAFGCICYEIFSGNIPFQEIWNNMCVMNAIVKGKRPTRPSQELCQTRGLNDKIWGIVEECWTMSPTERPTASQIVESLRYVNEVLAPQGAGAGTSRDMAGGDTFEEV